MNDRVSEEPAVVRVAYTIIQQAIRQGASEILLEPAKSGLAMSVEHTDRIAQEIANAIPDPPPEIEGPGLRASLNVGETWREIMLLPYYVRGPILERFKLMAHLDLSCTDSIQNGRIPVRWADKDYLLLVSTEPTPTGEQIVIRFQA